MLTATFWGVRGSIPVSSSAHVKYGGNTSCVEIQAGARRFVLDAGTGIRTLSNAFLKSDVRTVHLLLSHTHWDHIIGLPFFRPAFDPKCSVTIHAGHMQPYGGLRNVLSRQMIEPMFPVPLEAMKAVVDYEDFTAGDTFRLYPEVCIRTARLNHPNGATGYRIDHNGHSVCYVTDTEHVPGTLDENILALIEGADLVIYDSMYTEDEYPAHAGWGHSTWREGVRLCRAANVRQLAIFHHEPDHDDAFLDRLAGDARAEWPGAVVAREGMAITLD
jgi:phosphoribosyl 1,2-cyclic phosphodiesterase